MWRHRWSTQRRFVITVLIVSGTALAFVFVWLQVQRVRDAYRIAHLQSEEERLVILQRRLVVEHARLYSPSELEWWARHDLGLVPPDKRQRIMISTRP